MSTGGDQRALGYARTEKARQVFSVLGIPPEELAYTMAAYSRSRRSFLETNAFINSQKAAQFLERFYFNYGHRSIADMAHVPLALENISILSAIEVVAEQLWDGQERSTRYQDFSVTGYVIPDEVTACGLGSRYSQAADRLFEAYERVSQAVFSHYMEHVPRPAQMEERDFERTMRARAFDVGRYLLPLATNTSVGQITSARTLEAQIARLLSSPYPEVRRIGEAMRTASREVARDPRLERIQGLIAEAAAEAAALPEQSRLASILAQLAEAAQPAAAAPTLVRYTQPHAYRLQTDSAFAEVYQELLGGMPVEPSPQVTLVEVEDPIVEALSKLLYRVGYHPFAQIVAVVEGLAGNERRRLLDLAFQGRQRHDAWLAEFRVGYLNFDILMDIGSMRDLHRHRRCEQVRQPYTARHGYEVPEVLSACGVAELYQEAIDHALTVAREVNARCAPAGDYLLPLATRCRTLFSMDLAELIYIAELRTRPSGHFAYRRVAYEMFRAACRRYPEIEPYARVVHPDYEDLTER